jgi:FAD synthase
MSPDAAQALLAKLGNPGIYFGMATIQDKPQYFDIVASLGWNPFYQLKSPTFVCYSL